MHYLHVQWHHWKQVFRAQRTITTLRYFFIVISIIHIKEIPRSEKTKFILKRGPIYHGIISPLHGSVTFRLSLCDVKCPWHQSGRDRFNIKMSYRYRNESNFADKASLPPQWSWFTGKAVSLLTHRDQERKCSLAWWRHQMETFSTLLATCAGNSPVNSPHKGQWRGALMFSLICAWIKGWVNNGEADDLRRYRAHYMTSP